MNYIMTLLSTQNGIKCASDLGSGVLLDVGVQVPPRALPFEGVAMVSKLTNDIIVT
jgi:hypothetical protein